jgi:hypothetical protein
VGPSARAVENPAEVIRYVKIRTDEPVLPAKTQIFVFESYAGYCGAHDPEGIPDGLARREPHPVPGINERHCMYGLTPFTQCITALVGMGFS